ncbi:GntR family transcriptional regulator [Xanthobacter sp. YC-JY1]|uniref:GntR family transcriptional regulator n=1 Tax=Xanthobacter sp. YC-JY1 TaxID=2419844 RepID=UPI001F2F3CA2|nr:GntR family transcriptional regulator [Xanthobacter sp. YC-JY1]UJX45720.1 FCD domain-containing protein [Xanthobacter sp. YC-JY1]
MEKNAAEVAGRQAKVVGARSLVEAAYETLRQDILTGALPPGLKLRFEMLRERYGVGASTLREALTRLVGEALVTSEEQRGFRVAEISLDDFADLTAARKLVEIEALRQSIIFGDDAWEGALVGAYHRLSKVEEKLVEEKAESTELRDEFEARNRDFHFTLIGACPSRWVKHMHGILFQQSERYRRISLAARFEPRDVHAEHKAILEAALARNVDLACRLEAEHIDKTLALLSRNLPALT